MNVIPIVVNVIFNAVIDGICNVPYGSSSTLLYISGLLKFSVALLAPEALNRTVILFLTTHDPHIPNHIQA